MIMKAHSPESPDMDKTEGPSPEAEAVFDALVGGDEKKIRELGIKEIRGLSKEEIAEDERSRKFLEYRKGQFWRSLSDPKTKKELLDLVVPDETMAVSAG